MKKLISILAICAVSLNFVSCRQDDDAEVTAVNSQEKSEFNKANDTIKSDTVKVNTSSKPEVDPDPPVRDGTNW